MKPVRILLGAVLVLLIFITLYFSFIIIQAVVTDYQPDEVEQLEIEGQPENTAINDTVFTFLSWNIGFSGLGAEMDFFYDGGKMVHPTTALVNKYSEGILDFLRSNDSIDFFLLQEVDRNSSRTGRQNQVQLIQETLPGYSASFCLNYKVRFVPLPFFNPLGRVEMGQLNLASYFPDKAARYAYYSAYSWPKRLFMLDRCFVVSRFGLNNNKELVVINTHNSAYDSGGKLRQVELPAIRDFMLKEFESGNYVVAGGDWNLNPPDYNPDKLNREYNAVRREKMDASVFPPSWKIAYDQQHPTNREIDAPFSKEKTEVTIIDYFVVSPNMHVNEIKTIPNQFKFSDHEPVYINVSLKNYFGEQ